jgi:predicted NAD-dependent protein-ADP-ribosyltransferase YbiA (DUF1768 family)
MNKNQNTWHTTTALSSLKNLKMATRSTFSTIYKFSQNQALAYYLLQTGDAIIVEASPVDAIWGMSRFFIEKYYLCSTIK